MEICEKGQTELKKNAGKRFPRAFTLCCLFMIYFFETRHVRPKNNATQRRAGGRHGTWISRSSKGGAAPFSDLSLSRPSLFRFRPFFLNPALPLPAARHLIFFLRFFFSSKEKGGSNSHRYKNGTEKGKGKQKNKVKKRRKKEEKRRGEPRLSLLFLLLLSSSSSSRRPTPTISSTRRRPRPRRAAPAAPRRPASPPRGSGPRSGRGRAGPAA